MFTSRLIRAAALALVIAALPGSRTARAGDPASDARSIRERISQGVAAGLAQQPAAEASPAPRLTSHPAALRSTHPVASHAAADSGVATLADTSAAGLWAELLAGNRRFVADHPRTRALVRERDALVAGQHPRVVVLGCADSRVSPELVFDQSLGELFVVRTAGNIVDPIALGSIEYAVEHLHARLLVVLGHGGCGAVKAAAAGTAMPSAHLQAIVDRIAPTVKRLSACFEGDELVERSVIANARQSAVDVVGNSELLRAAAAHGELAVMSAVYDLKTGAVTLVGEPAATAQAQEPVH